MINFSMKGSSMEDKGNILNLAVGNLKKLGFDNVKFVNNRRFKYYVTCGEVVEWSMRQFFKYIYAVVRNWCGIIGFILALIGIISVALGITILIPSWIWVIIGIIALIWAQFSLYDKVRKERDEASNEVVGAIRELEGEVIKVGGKDIDMASLFWKMGERFLNEGMRPDSIPNGIYGVFEGAEKEECNKAWVNLMKRLRLLQLIFDKEYPHPHKSTGYIRIQLTSLGASVFNELDRKWRSR